MDMILNNQKNAPVLLIHLELIKMGLRRSIKLLKPTPAPSKLLGKPLMNSITFLFVFLGNSLQINIKSGATTNCGLALIIKITPFNLNCH
jgi:hypothetical protein